jgi:hypothetical protein
VSGTRQGGENHCTLLGVQQVDQLNKRFNGPGRQTLQILYDQ